MQNRPKHGLTANNENCLKNREKFYLQHKKKKRIELDLGAIKDVRNDVYKVFEFGECLVSIS